MLPSSGHHSSLHAGRPVAGMARSFIKIQKSRNNRIKKDGALQQTDLLTKPQSELQKTAGYLSCAEVADVFISHSDVWLTAKPTKPIQGTIIVQLMILPDKNSPLVKKTMSATTIITVSMHTFQS